MYQLSGDEIELPIHHEFYSYDKKAPFTNCVDCEKELLKSGEPYLIEKAIRNYPGFTAQDTIFEYAICMECQQKMQKTMSQESLRKINQYFMQNVRELSVYEPDLPAEGFIQDRLSRCILKDNTRDELSEYQIYAFCKGDKMLAGAMPFMIGGAAVDDMNELISAETRDELNRFIDDNFGLPPELKKSLKKDFVFV